MTDSQRLTGGLLSVLMRTLIATIATAAALAVGCVAPDGTIILSAEDYNDGACQLVRSLIGSGQANINWEGTYWLAGVDTVDGYKRYQIFAPSRSFCL